jgi:hypothetical protein
VLLKSHKLYTWEMESIEGRFRVARLQVLLEQARAGGPGDEVGVIEDATGIVELVGAGNYAYGGTAGGNLVVLSGAPWVTATTVSPGPFATGDTVPLTITSDTAGDVTVRVGGTLTAPGPLPVPQPGGLPRGMGLGLRYRYRRGPGHPQSILGLGPGRGSGESERPQAPLLQSHPWCHDRSVGSGAPIDGGSQCDGPGMGCSPALPQPGCLGNLPEWRP